MVLLVASAQIFFLHHSDLAIHLRAANKVEGP